MPGDLTDPQGSPVNAAYGFTRFLGDFLESVQPDFLAVAFDVSLSTSFRNELYPPYKANRVPAPPELRRQFALCREITRALGIREFADTAYEADDLIGSLATCMRAAGHRVTIVSRDKDLLQLLEQEDRFWDYPGGRPVAHHQVRETLGVRAEQIPDFLGLAGDSSDNIPGVPGIGRKTAARLLAHFDSLEDIYGHIGRLEALRFRGAAGLARRLLAHRARAELCRELARIRCDAPLEAGESTLRRRSPLLERLFALYDSAGFGAALRAQAERLTARCAA